LGHTRHLAGVGQLAEADAAQHELAEHGARATATLAAGVGPYLELRLALLLLDERLFRHYCPSLRKGKSNASRRALPSASVRAVVTIVMSMPLVAANLSQLIFGKISCSVTPNV